MELTPKWLLSKGFTDVGNNTYEKVYGDTEGDYTALGVLFEPKIKVYLRQQHRHGKFQLLCDVISFHKLKTKYHIEILWCMVSGQRL